MRFTLKFFIFLVVSLFSSMGFSEGLGPVTFCGDGGGWPPFHYKKDDRVQGYDIDVATEIFNGAGLQFKAEMPPWKRCLAETEKGQKYQVAFSSSYKDDRAKTFKYTDAYYELHGYYFYSKKTFPNGINITSTSDLGNYKVCGLSGYSYQSFGVETSTMDTQSRSFEAVIKKTQSKRCDIFLARYEIVKGFGVVGNDLLGSEIDAKPLPWMEGDKFYMLVSRNYPNSDKLVELLNKGFKSLKENGKLDVMISKYLK